MQAIKWATLLFGAIFVVVVAGAINAPHLYYMAAILLTLPGISYLLGALSLYQITFRRTVPSVAWAGEENEILYVAENPTRIARYFLSCREPLPDWIEPLSDQPPLFNASARSTTQISYPIRLLRRGVYPLEGFDAVATDPLGVFSFTRTVTLEEELVVYPTPQHVRHWQMSGAERYGWQEFTVVATRGSSVDPDGVRAYVPGDPLRRIHWRQTARTGNLSVIEFEEPQSIQIYLLLDQEAGHNIGSGVDTTFEYGVRFCASVAWQVIQQNASVRMVGIDAEGIPEIDAFPNARGEMQLMRILESLARVEPTRHSPIATLVQETAGNVPNGSTLVIVTSNPDPHLAESVLLHRAGGVLPIVVYIDPNSFAKRPDTALETKQKDFLQRILGAGAKVFIVRYQSDGSLFPEGIFDGDA